MSDENLILTVFGGMFLLTCAAAFGLSRLSRHFGNRAASSLATEAAAKGWHFEAATNSGSDELYRWRGSTNGIGWTAEHRRIEDGSREFNNRRDRTHWQAALANGPATPVLIFAEGSSIWRPASPSDGTLVHKLTAFGFDKALDLYFGSATGAQVDAAALRPVEGARFAGVVVMAADPSAASRVLALGISEPVMQLFAGGGAPVILLLPTSIHLARIEPLSTADLERFARGGTAIVTRIAKINLP
jgi:hypothetical protein